MRTVAHKRDVLPPAPFPGDGDRGRRRARGYGKRTPRSYPSDAAPTGESPDPFLTGATGSGRTAVVLHEGRPHQGEAPEGRPQVVQGREVDERGVVPVRGDGPESPGPTLRGPLRPRADTAGRRGVVPLREPVLDTDSGDVPATATEADQTVGETAIVKGADLGSLVPRRWPAGLHHLPFSTTREGP